MYSFWRSEDKILILGNEDNIIEESDQSTFDADELAQALIGQGNRVSLENPTIDDFDDNQLALLEAYLEKHPSSLSGDELSCIPSWDCSIDPIVCPPHGTQITNCIDLNKCASDTQRTRSCQPGICSGCLQDDGNCIPYGIRLNEYEYDPDSAQLYCNVNGRIESQKGNDARCNNDFECTSGECRAGICVDTYTEVVTQSGTIKRIWCFLTNLSLLGGTEEDYQQCLND